MVSIRWKRALIGFMSLFLLGLISHSLNATEVTLSGYEVHLYNVSPQLSDYTNIPSYSNMAVTFDKPTGYQDYEAQPDPIIHGSRTGRYTVNFIPIAEIEADGLKSKLNCLVTSGWYEVHLVAVGLNGAKSKQSDGVVINVMNLTPTPPRISQVKW